MRSHVAITLRNMRFHTLVGVLPHEREFPQPLEIDLSVWLRPGGEATPPVLDYRRLYDDTAAVIARGPIGYIEELAQSLGNAALRYEVVERVRVAVRKPHVALPGPLDAAEIELELSREE